MPLVVPDTLRDALTKPVAVFGSGLSGQGVLALLRVLGLPGVCYDERETAFRPEHVSAHHLAVFSPGFPAEHAWLKLARAGGLACLGEMDFAALFWKGSTKWGALASTLWVAAAVVAVAAFQQVVPAPAPGPSVVYWSIGGSEIISRTPGGTAVWGFMQVVPMVIISALLMFTVSKLTSKPSQKTISKYFDFLYAKS